MKISDIFNFETDESIPDDEMWMIFPNGRIIKIINISESKNDSNQKGTSRAN